MAVHALALITSALALSPASLYHDRAEAWWGRPVDVRVALVRVDGDWAATKVTAPGETQWVLHRAHVVTWVTEKAVRFYCHDAPRGVIVALVGGCQITLSRFRDDVWIRGPTDRRRVTRSFGRCAHPVVHVSRLDPSWVVVDNCAASGGSYFLHHWRHAVVEVDGPGCDWAPPGIIRSLHGFCQLFP